jgi:uncharacterized YigZ family protein
MLILEKIVTLEQTIKKSRFAATAGPVASEQDAKDFIAVHSDPKANHNCWAWRLGHAYRCSDDGEPSGTAGRPILQAIDRLNLDKAAVVVTRWFGGILLGSGGLIRAYGGTAAACLRTGQLVDIVPVRRVSITVAFSDGALVKARLAHAAGIRILQESFTEAGSTLMVEVPEENASEIARMIMDITSGRASVVMDPGAPS